VLGRIPLPDLGHAALERHALAVRSGRHVRVPEQVAHERALVAKLGQLGREAEELGFRDGRRVEGHEPDDPLRPTDVLKVAGAVERVKAGRG